MQNHSPFLGESPLQAALRSGWSLEDLNTKLGIKCKRHPKHPNLVLFVYDQIKSPKMDPIVQASRGHILDQDNNWSHVCRPFDRFFNWGEGISGVTPTPDIRKSVVFKKEDGSLINMWFYRGECHVSTKGSPDAGGEVGDNSFTFAELFWRVWNDSGLFVPDTLDHDRTLSFELCTLHNRVVCSQPEERIVLIGARDNEGGRELDPYAYDGEIKTCKSYDLGNFDDIVQTFKDLPAMEMEGYVVAQFLPDGRVIRAKVKHPGYLALAHLKEGSTTRNFLNLVRMNDEGEFLASFPEYKPKFDVIKSAYEALVSSLEASWESVKDISIQKDFALAIASVPCRSALFQKRSQGTDIRDSLANMNVDFLIKILDLKE